MGHVLKLQDSPRKPVLPSPPSSHWSLGSSACWLDFRCSRTWSQLLHFLLRWPPRCAVCCTARGKVTSFPWARNRSLSSRPAKVSLCQSCSQSCVLLPRYGRDEGGRERGRWGGSFHRGDSLCLGARRFLHLCDSWDGTLRPPTKPSSRNESEFTFQLNSVY